MATVGGLCFIFSLVLFSFAARIPLPDDLVCEYGSCGECTSDTGCGWCESADQSSCLIGNENGPTDSTCNNGLWKYGTCAQDDSCSVRTACSTCIEVDGCGWCDSRCVVGNSTEPINNEVPCDQWIYGEDTCNTVSCSAFQTCNVCTSQSNCAWCSSAISTGQPECQTGNVYTTHPIDCSLPDWYPESAECPTPPACSTYENCGDCLADPNELCGWCKEQNQCIMRSDYSTCTDFQENSCNDDCTNFLTCELCSLYSSCGWCESVTGTAFCTYGNSTGPTYFEGSSTCTKSWSYLECPPCNYDNCASCNNDGSCSWCYSLSGNLLESCYEKTNLPQNSTCVPKCLSTTPTATPQPTTPSLTPSISFSPSPSTSFTPTATNTTSSPSSSPSPSPSSSNSSSSSASFSPSPSPSLSLIVTNATRTSSASVSVTSSNSSSSTISLTPSPSASNSSSVTQSPSLSSTPSPSASNSSFISQTISTSPSPSPSPSPSSSNSSTTSPSFTPSPSPSNSSSIPQTPSTSASPSSTSSNSSSKSLSSTPSASPSNSTFSSISSSTSLSSSSSPCPSPSYSPSISYSASASKSEQSTISMSGSSSVSSSASPIILPSKSSTSTATASKSASGSTTKTSTATGTSTSSPEPTSTMTSTRSITHTPFSRTPSLSISSSESPIVLPTLNPNVEPEIHWAMVVFLSVSSLILLAVIILVGGFVFHRYYWSRRWYFEKLE